MHPIQIGTHAKRFKSCGTNYAHNMKQPTHKKELLCIFCVCDGSPHTSGEYLQVPNARVATLVTQSLPYTDNDSSTPATVCVRGMGMCVHGLWRRLIYPPLYCFCLMHRHDRGRRRLTLRVWVRALVFFCRHWMNCGKFYLL